MNLESAEWVRALGSPGADRDAAVDRLYGILLLAARDEIRRRSEQLRIAGPEADDLAHQSAGDALMAISETIGQVPRREPVHHLGLQVRHARGLDQDRASLLARSGGSA